MSKLENLTAYTVVEKKELKEVNGYGYILSHNKTKARVAVIENDDTNKVFTIGFRTPPADDTGVPHITEHSVLCGSRKFPVKDPFVELCKGSLNTFLNAMTYSDKTVYPLASLNEKDFHNLMHVYMDAVFYPDMYEKKEIMMQEGWHYEIDEETGELTYNGVVFNEMKGVYSSPEQQLYRIIEKSLLPHTAYGFESGGDPEAIPNLTQEDFIAFHKRYYHPSNSYIYLYGDMDAAEELTFIDEEYLQNFDYAEIDSALTDEPAFEKPVTERAYYSISENESEQDNTYLAYNMVIGTSADKKLCAAFAILEYALLSAPGAPLKKALIDAGLGKDILSSFDDGIKQPNFSIIAKNANAEDLERFIQVLEDTLASIVEQGMDKKSLLAAINYFEFKHKEGNFGRFPKGLMLGLNAFSTWLYDDAAALDLFSLNDVYDALKQDVETGYFEQLIEKHLLHNPHRSVLLLVPERGLTDKKDQELADRLQAYKETLTAEEIEKIVEKTAAMKAFQEEPDRPEDLAKIPLLERSDIRRKIEPIILEERKIEDTKLIYHKIATNGVSYFRLLFDISEVPAELFAYVGILKAAIGLVDTQNYSYQELFTQTDLLTGGIVPVTNIYPNITNPSERKITFEIKGKAFHAHLKDAMELTAEMLVRSNYTDTKRLYEILTELKSRLQSSMISAGHTIAAGRAMSYTSETAAIQEILSGMDFYRLVDRLCTNWDEEKEKLPEILKRLSECMFRPENLMFDFTAEEEDQEKLFEAEAKALKKDLFTCPVDREPVHAAVSKKNEGFLSASQVQYVCRAGNYKKNGLEYTGVLRMLRGILNTDYLWNTVRVKGGAYGCMCSFGKSGDAYIASYRDPNLGKTIEAYEGIVEYVAHFAGDERSMTQAVIGTVSEMDAPMNPAAKALRALSIYLTGQTAEQLQKERDQVLDATAGDIRALAGHMKAFLEDDCLCVVGNTKKIEEEKERFGTLEQLL